MCYLHSFGIMKTYPAVSRQVTPEYVLPTHKLQQEAQTKYRFHPDLK